MNMLLSGLVLLSTVICLGESTDYTLNDIVGPFLDCVQKESGAKVVSKDLDIKTADQADSIGYGLQVDTSEAEIDEENAIVYTQDVLLTYPDQEDVNDGPTQLEVEMEDAVKLSKQEYYVQEDKLTLGSKVYRVDEILKDGRVYRRGSTDISELVGNKTADYVSTRKYKLEPYTTAFVRTTIVRQNVTYPVTKSVYVFGTFAVKFSSNIRDDVWGKCGNPDWEDKPEKGSKGYYVNIASVTSDPNYLTEDNEIDFTLTDKLHRIEEKVIMKINARVNKDKKQKAYDRLCVKD